MNTTTVWLLIICLVAGCSEQPAPLSFADRNAITNIVGKENKGSIKVIERMQDGTVHVSTQIPSKSGGDLFTITKTNAEWRVIERGVWMN